MVGYFSPGYSLLTASSATISRMKKKTMKFFFFWAAFFFFFFKRFSFSFELKIRRRQWIVFFFSKSLVFPVRDVFVLLLSSDRCVQKILSRLCVCVFQVFNDGTTPFLIIPSGVCQHYMQWFASLLLQLRKKKSKKSVGNTSAMLEWCIQVMNGSWGFVSLAPTLGYITHCSCSV